MSMWASRKKKYITLNKKNEKALCKMDGVFKGTLNINIEKDFCNVDAVFVKSWIKRFSH